MGTARENTVLRAQLADAMRDVTRWLSIAESGEERQHLRQVQLRLGELQAILDRVEIRWRVKTRVRGEPPLPSEAPEWAENVTAFLGAFQDARDVRGSSFGGCLSRLVARLKRETAKSEAPTTVVDGRRKDAGTVPASKPIERGRFCDQVIDEIKRIKNLCQASGRSVAEVQHEHPDWAVWTVRDHIGPEDKDAFSHPRQWGPTVGYAKMILSKIHGVTADTITSWVKAYRRSRKAK